MANAKLDVDIASFVSDINTAKGVLKGLNAEMKAADAEFKATGNSEQQLTAKTKTLNSQIRMQKSIVDNASKALEAMKDDGVDPADAAYQRMYATMMNANAGMNEAQAQLNALGSSAQEAATGADQLTSSVNKIGKKISLDQVISGIDKITTGLSNAAKKAVELGKELWNNVMDSAALSDDILTQATILDMTPEQYQQYKGVFDTIADITVKDWMNAKRKVEKAMNDPTNDQMDALKALGLGRFVDKYGVVRTQEIADNWEDGLWRIAGELQKRVSSGEISMEMADVYGEALFGKNFSALKPLFDLGKEGFIAALKDQAVISDDALKKNTALNDKVIELDASFKALQAEVVSGLAPALTSAATALDGVLKSVLEYLQKPEGKKMLEDLGTAVSGLFDDLGKIDPEQVVEGITGVIGSVFDAVTYIVENKNGIFEALKWIVISWAGLEVAGGILEIIKIVGGLADLAGISAAGTAAGAAWGGAFASAVAAAAPWLVGLWTLLNPSAGSDAIGNNTLIDENGNLTNEAKEYGYTLNENGEADLNRRSVMEKIAQEAWDLYRTGKFDKEALANVQGLLGTDEMTSLFAHMQEVVKSNPEWMNLEDLDITKWLDDFEPVDIPAEIANQTTAEEISEAVGTVEINGVVHITGVEGENLGVSGNWWGGDGSAVYKDRRPKKKKANGMWYVPYDGMLASLHKGERIMPAREVQSRSYNSNLYVESMYMNNGTDAAGLAAAMAAAQRRTMSGFGS